MELISSKIVNDIYLNAGDSLHISYTDKLGNNTNVSSTKITEAIVVDVVNIFKVSDEFELSSGYCAMFGKSKD